MVVDGVECITLAHEMRSPAVLRHPVWGTKIVHDHLKQQPGYPDVSF